MDLWLYFFARRWPICKILSSATPTKALNWLLESLIGFVLVIQDILIAINFSQCQSKKEPKWKYLTLLCRANLSECVTKLDDSLQRVALYENQNLCRVRHKLKCLTSIALKKSVLSLQSDINYSEWNCQCWTGHLTLQSQTNSDTNFFIREYWTGQ